MLKKRYIKLCSAIAMSLVLVSGASFTNVKAASVNRIGGQSRYATAKILAESVFKTAENVILVNGQGYADAVSATPLAKKLGAPILLTESNMLSDGVLSSIQKLGAKNVYIVGGEGVVTPTIYAKLKANGLNVVRYAKDGGNRFDTNAVVAEEVIKRTGSKQAILVNGQDGYSDALSVASIAAKLEIPVLISSSNSIDPAVKKVIDNNGLKIMAVGGTGVLKDSVIKLVGATRIAQGKDRFATNINVLSYFKPSLSFDKVYVAAGGNDSSKNFADALVASAAAAKDGSPVVLSGLGAKSEDILNSKNFVKNNMSKNTNIILVGSTGVLSETIEADFNKLAEEISQDELEIIDIQ
ncbi:cell wall-binding repeat-containing protein [Clostridium rectalis]|uniref:cell wall-binding repeat-containing protein n=1 Tax=Clostridium rectalis TaxID=2040295 RepID=UPI000F63FCE3|nr:cell wall-binding repeat-containing protein [Clostridium rectalis]